ncbi:MAG: 1,4-dihydroxy-2-naphthoate octaprenyltransferase [Kiritimatiellia bacterium]
MNLIAEKPSTLRMWFVALRPFSFSVSVLPVFFGTTLAWESGFTLRWPLVLLLVSSVLFLHAAANLLNDYYDHQRGVDREVLPVSGAIVRGWIRPQRIRLAAWIFLVSGIVAGIAVIGLHGWWIANLGAVGVLLAWGYTRKDFCLKYAGWGDLAILLAFGILPVMAGWLIHVDRITWQPIWWSIPAGLLGVAILHANNWRDISRDAANGCYTLAVRIGTRGSRRYWQCLLIGVLGFVVVSLVGVHWMGVPLRAPVWTLLALATFPAIAQLVRTDWALHPDAMASLDARAARLHLLFMTLLCLGFIIARLW